MRINSFGSPCVPVPEPAPQFMKSVVVDEIHAVLDKDGKSISEEKVSVSRVVPISPEEFRNEGVTCDLFGVEVSQRAGVQLNDYTSQFFGVPLDQRDSLENVISSGLDSIEAELSNSKNDSSTINFE